MLYFWFILIIIYIHRSKQSLEMINTVMLLLDGIMSDSPQVLPSVNKSYPIYTEQNYLDCDMDDIYLDRDPDVLFTLDIHRSNRVALAYWFACPPLAQ